MHQITFELETITPLFLAGADGKKPELRPPSFKGMMRFWWRAVKGAQDTKELLKEEESLFGGSGKDAGRSKVQIRIVSNLLNEAEYSPVPHSSTKKFKFRGISPQQTFCLGMSCRDESELRYYQAVFAIAIFLGGIGKRSRRGFGSLRITKIGEKNYDQDSLESLSHLLNQIKPGGYSLQSPSTILVNATSVLAEYPWIEKIEMGKSYSSPTELLKEIGQASSKFTCDSLGFAGKQGRLASPMYVSVIQRNDEYYPVITSLHTVFPNRSGKVDPKRQQDFRSAIL